MVEELPKSVKGAELVTGIVGTIDIGSTLAKIIEFKTEEANTETIRKRIHEFIEACKTTYMADWLRYAQKDFDDVKSEQKILWQAYLKETVTKTRNQLMQSVLGLGATASMLGLETKIYNSVTGLDVLTDGLYGIPQQIALEKARRYWNRTLSPNYPNEKDLLLLWKNAKETTDNVKKYYQEIHGLKEDYVDDIVEMRKYQLGYPSLNILNSLYQLNRIGKTTLKEYMKANYGYSEKMCEDVLDLIDYTPSPFEILRLSDLIPIDVAWAEQQLRENGLAPAERAIYQKAISQRPLRDEITRMASTLYELYQYGAMSDKEFLSFLDSFNITDKEKEAKLKVAKLLREKYVRLLKRDARIYLYRKGVYLEEELKEKLIQIGFSLDVVNSIVELEAAKMGKEYFIEEE
jgi:hypothetical protein